MMKKDKIFVACDSTSISQIKRIIKDTRNSRIKIGYKFGLEFLNSKNGRKFVSKLKNKIIFADLKLHDIPNTCKSAIKSIKDLRIDYLTIHISSGLEALRTSKKVSGKTKLVGVTILTSLDVSDGTGVGRYLVSDPTTMFYFITTVISVSYTHLTLPTILRV